MYGIHINEEIEKFVDMYISCDVSLLPNPLQNAQHQHTRTCKKRNHVVCRFHYPLPRMCDIKKIITSSKKLKLSIFTIVPPNTSK
jgi:hypothetical protein